MNFHILSDNGERAINQEGFNSLDILDATDALEAGESKAVFITTASNKEEALASLAQIAEYILKDL